MRHRVLRLTFGGFVFVALGGVAGAAVPDDGTQPADKPALSHASPMINDPATTIHGNAPITIVVPKDNLQADMPDGEKPPLYRASPMIDDPLTGTSIRGKAPTGTNMVPHDDVQAEVPGATKPPLYRASPMINDPLIGKPIQPKPPQ